MSKITPQLEKLLIFIRSLYGESGVVPLHAPRFGGREKQYLNECLESTFVSSVGPFVERFEAMMRDLTGARHAVACVNGTAALHAALILAGVKDGDEVIVQPLTFVASCNAIAYQRAHPVFVDVDRETIGLSPVALLEFLRSSCEKRAGQVFNRLSGRRIGAVLAMHTFGHPADLKGLVQVCDDWSIPLIEDAAEAIGSKYRGRSTGTFGLMGTFSFNGNKSVTCGGGGCIITDNDELGKLAKHLTTTAKRPHPYEFYHDQVGYNYRLPNLNAALACAQLEQLPNIISNKRETAARYEEFCRENKIQFLHEPSGSTSNYWLNSIICESRAERDAFLQASNERGINTRPVWTLMNRLPAFANAQCLSIPVAEWYEDRIVNLPSSVRL